MLLAAVSAVALAGCPVFPGSFSTNQRVDTLPVAASSDAIVRSIGLPSQSQEPKSGWRCPSAPIALTTAADPDATGSRSMRSFHGLSAGKTGQRGAAGRGEAVAPPPSSSAAVASRSSRCTVESSAVAPTRATLDQAAGTTAAG